MALNISYSYYEQKYVTPKDILFWLQGSRKKISAFLFFTWEEGTIPLNAAAIIDFRRKLRQTKRAAETEIVLCRWVCM